ncbi:YicC/YloC family endoribonuclease [Butyrivibrio sp. MC2013]|uniref:YicC/YloC family endoribonuclease n=1 Tax=Butyrivibrio sp. MC2013 TaxID=1280686 RepID=UPI00040E27FD|nr:YicC/YloC family endoribonuclease [Butyrivibrio sp. MC2013]
MVYSMTGFGKSENISEAGRISVEIKSVNNRYLDLGLKMPRMFNSLEAEIRRLLKQYMKRGKVDVYISYEAAAEAATEVKYNHDIAGAYLSGMKQMSEDFGLGEDIRLSSIAHMPEVFTLQSKDINEEELWESLKAALEEAAGKFASARLKEGEFLKKDLMDKLDIMEKDVDFITERSPMIVEEYKSGLKQKIAELLDDNQIDESRLAMEVTLFADKVCVDEELVRLRSHIGTVREILEKGDEENGIGRKLDFIAQELNREANTTLSKTTDIEVSDHAINLKTTIEKIREQIQNIE